MGRTKLFQEPRSPLIQGHSRSRRKFFQEWVFAVSGGVAAIVLLSVVERFFGNGEAATFGATLGLVLDQLVSDGLMLLVASGFATLGVWLARRMGWWRPWIAGAVVSFASFIIIRGIVN